MPRAQKICDGEILTRAVGEIDNGLSIYKASRQFGIPETTLRDHARGRYSGYQTTFGRSRCITDTEERSLVTYIEYMADRGFPLTRQMIKILTLEIIRQSGRETLINQEKGPTNKWMKKFFSRHPQLALRKAHTLDKARASVEQSQIDQYFDLLQDTLKRLDLSDEPARVYNCDETGFSGSLNSSGREVVVKKGVRQAYRVQMTFTGHVTVHYAISAAGRTHPPLVIFSKNSPRASYAEGLPDDWMFDHTESGFINADLFFKWFTELFIPACGAKRPCLLLMDNLAAHMSVKLIDAAKENGIDLLYFPAHCSHLLQPLDVGYFHVLKSNVVDLAQGLGYAGARCLPRHLFPKVLHHAMNKISPSVVASAFSATGIYPLKKSAVKALTGPINNPTPADSDKNSDSVPIASTSEFKPNMLVRMGMIPESLANIFLEPAEVTSKKRKNSLPTARVIVSDKCYVQKKKSRKISSDEMTAAPSNTIHAPDTDTHEDADSDAICVVCMTNSTALFWVGCDSCNAWFHYECLPTNEQTDVDFSLLCKTPWCCLACRREE